MSNHFSKPAKRQSVLVRSSSYRDNCKSGFCTGFWEAHHVLCKHAVAARDPGDNADYVEDCLWITDWDINNKGNMIGLPVNKQYRASLGKVPVNLPSHQNDHNTKNGYTKECEDYLNKQVWNKLNKKQKAHELNAEDIKKQLEAGSSHFKKLLLARGARKKGTIHCWDNRFPSSDNYEEKWYYPFSMGKKPNKRHPGIDWANLTRVFKKIN